MVIEYAVSATSELQLLM